MYRQACKEVSGMWSRKLRTIYWDASTSFSEDVILNIRRIQETSSSYKDYPGLQSLWIDFFEEKKYGAIGMLRLHWIFSEFEPAAPARLLGVARYMSFRSSKAVLINGYSDYHQRMTADTRIPCHGERNGAWIGLYLEALSRCGCELHGWWEGSQRATWKAVLRSRVYALDALP